MLGCDTKGVKRAGVNQCCGLGHDAKGEWGVDVEGEDPADLCGGPGHDSKGGMRRGFGSRMRPGGRMQWARARQQRQTMCECWSRDHRRLRVNSSVKELNQTKEGRETHRRQEWGRRERSQGGWTGLPPGVSTGVLPEESTGVGASAAGVGGAGVSPGVLTGE
jgi:hypothetical protein